MTFNIIPISAFIGTPTSVNATLGSTATFNCSATKGLIGWLVNGLPLTVLNLTANSVGNIHSLHVPATERYNNTDVVCGVFFRSPFSNETSDPAVLRVQGMFTKITQCAYTSPVLRPCPSLVPRPRAWVEANPVLKEGIVQVPSNFAVKS